VLQQKTPGASGPSLPPSLVVPPNFRARVLGSPGGCGLQLQDSLTW
jgi:hypothetical protein